MDFVISLTENIPVWMLAAGGALIAAVIAVLIVSWKIRKNTRGFIKYLGEALENDSFSNEIYPSSYIRKRSRHVENFAASEGSRIVYLSGLNRQWLQQLKDKPSEKNVKRILAYIPEEGLFSCFLAALEKPSLTKLLLMHLGEEAGSLRALPLSGSGEPFNGEKAAEIFSNRMDEIREMAGDPEWPVRYFSVKLLLNEDSDRSRRGIMEAFSDPHPLIRKTVAEECPIDDRVKIYDHLKNLLLNDPSFEVRLAAYQRISKDFSDIHRIDYPELTAVQALHALEFLDSSIENDIDAALNFLEGDDLELRFPSAMFLQNAGVLGKKLRELNFEDSKELERTTMLLTHAAEVRITGFLNDRTDKPAPVFTALNILKTTGEKERIAGFAGKAFDLNENTELKVWKTAVECIETRGGESAVKILMNELLEKKYEDEKPVFILEHIPGGFEHITFEPLLALLKDEKFGNRELLTDAIAAVPEDLVIPEVFKILQGGRTAYPHNVRISALQILAKFKLQYCIQPIIEQLPTLPVDEAKEFSSLLSEFAGKIFDERVLKLLTQPDGKVRASVIASLPGTSKKSFINNIKDALSDADPDVRIAGVWALADYNEIKALNQAFDLLRDPVERVRSAAAEVLGKFGNASRLDSFSELFRDENEVNEVKRSAITGLSKSEQNKAIDIIVEVIDENEELETDAVKALADSPSKKAITRIIENMKDASPVLRDKMMNIFKMMGESGEQALMKLLAEDIASLKESIIGILETTGYVEHVIRKLSHRDPAIRRSAASFLSMMGTKAAFRGIVLAARDPDQDVRVQVTRALEKLNTKSGEEILESLKNDPDKRVRKFTMWALARTKAKSIED